MFLRTTIENLLRRGSREGIMDKIILFPFYLFSLLYGLIINIRLFLYRNSILPSYKLPFKVISIGNISLGGTGKTPVAIYIGNVLKGMGYNIAILSRGYKSKREKEVTILSDGEKILLNPQECGDEPYLIASKLNGVPVLTGKDRYLSGRLANERFKIDIAILDDGFQHLKLKRDIDIVLVTPNTLISRNYLLPRGYLRESIQALERSTLVMIKDVDKGFKTNLEKPVFHFKYKPISLINLKDGSKYDVGFLKDKSVVAMCGIASPDAFFSTLERSGAVILERLIYPDHHHYSSQDIKSMEEISKKSGFMITTEKDAVNLKGLIPQGLNIYALEIEVEVFEKEGFVNILKGLL